MIYFFKKNSSLIILILLFTITFIILNIFLFEKIIPLISNGKLNYLGLLAGDASKNHNLAISHSNQLINGDYFIFLQDLLHFNNIPLNTKILGIIYFLFWQDPITIIYLNSIYFIISIICIYKLSIIFFDNFYYSKIFSIIIGIFFLFFPSIAYCFNSSGKESMIITFTLVYLVFFISISKSNFHISIPKLVGFIFIFFILYCYRPHVSYMFFILSIITLVFYIFDLTRNKLIVINFVKLILSMLSVYILFNFISTDQVAVINIIETDMFKKNTIENYQPNNFLIELYNKIVSLRIHFINYSLSIGSNNLISSDINGSSFIAFLIYVPKLLTQGVLAPYPFTLSSATNDIFLFLTNIEMIILYLVYLGFLINYKHLKKYELILILFCIFACALLLFINPNIGTHYRVRQPFTLILLIFGIKNWILIFINMYIKKITNNSLGAYNKLFIKLKNSLITLLILFVFSLLILFREIIIIKYLGINTNLSIYLLSMMLLSIFTSTINNPLNDVLLTSRDFKVNNLNNNENISLIIVLILSFAALSILFLLNVSNFFTLFNMNYNINYSFSIFILFFLFSIPINAIFTTHLYIKDKSVIVYLNQLIVPLISILFIYIFNKDLSINILFNSITLGIILNSLILIIISSFYKFNYRIFLNFSLTIKKNKSFSNFLKVSLNLLIINSLIIISLYYISNLGTNNSLFTTIGLRFTLLFNAILAAVFTSIFMPIINKDNFKSLSILINFIILLCLLSLILTILSSLIFNQIIYISSNSNITSDIINIFNSFKLLLPIIPLSIAANLFFKYFIIKYETNKFIFICSIVAIFFIFMLEINPTNSSYFILKFLATAFSLIILSSIFIIPANNLQKIFTLIIIICFLTITFFDINLYLLLPLIPSYFYFYLRNFKND